MTNMKGMLPRRIVVVVTLLVLATCLPATARTVTNASGVPVVAAGGAEWNDRFDTASPAVQPAVRTVRTTLGEGTVAAMELAIERYGAIARRGGWGSVPPGPALSIGDRDPRVVALRQRLVASDDLRRSAGIRDVFDSYVDAAVRRFQARHGLLPDGVVGGETLDALNVPVERRVEQLSLNLVRVRSMAGDLGERYVLVNIPAAEVEAVEDGSVQGRYTAIVGKPERASPILKDRIDYITFNPFWTVPKSIIRRDIIPMMRKDPTYLDRYNIRIFDGTGSEIAPTEVDWNSEEAVGYRLRQDPGEINSLGYIRINFPNEHSVYLHDTPKTSLFGTNDRFYSSGCVRVQNVRQLVSWLLEPNEGNWDRMAVDAAVRNGETENVTLARRTPIYFAYITAWAAPGGAVQFRPDIYGRDGLTASNARGESSG